MSAEKSGQWGSVPVGKGREATIVVDDDGAREIVFRDAGGTRRRKRTRSQMSWRTDTGPWVTHVPDGTLLSGDLVAGSSSIDVTAPVEPREVVVAAGIYMALLPAHVRQGQAYVVFRDSSGQIVPWPHEGVLKREKVADADRPCPACGNLAWDAIEVRTAPTATRYRRRGLVCGACGLQFGGWTEVGRRRPGRDERVVAPEWDLDFDDEDRDAKIVKSAGFAVYGPDRSLLSIVRSTNGAVRMPRSRR